jgi:hypothetical protein
MSGEHPGPGGHAAVATTVNSIMLGAEHYPQPGDECFDDIILRTTS